jgi:hypothetical protein
LDNGWCVVFGNISKLCKQVVVMTKQKPLPPEKEYVCLNCGHLNKIIPLTEEQKEKCEQVAKNNPYESLLPKGICDQWCNKCDAHHTLLNGKPVSSSGGSFWKRLLR